MKTCKLSKLQLFNQLVILLNFDKKNHSTVCLILWKSNFKQNLLLYSLKPSQIRPNGSPPGTQVRCVTWMPRSSELLYNYDNNIYLRRDIKEPEKDVQLTSNGDVESIFNGMKSNLCLMFSWKPLNFLTANCLLPDLFYPYQALPFLTKPNLN